MLIIALLFAPLLSQAEIKTPVLASLSSLQTIGASIAAKSDKINLGREYLNESQQNELLELNHKAGRCGGFEALPASESSVLSSHSILSALESKVALEKSKALQYFRPMMVERKPEIQSALTELREENIRSTVQWLSSYPSRNNRLSDPNQHVLDMQTKLRTLLEGYPGIFSVDLISHSSTRQKSVRVHLEGKARPREIIVLGGHLDSINRGWGSESAPGADDNASGSASLMEALRVVAAHGRPERSVEFFWYAGEESGLLGSAEIAQQYKREAKDVVAVLQLDMTMFPGAGEFVVGSMTDFTSAWLRSYLMGINEAYLNVRVVESECGYGCSDHASWFRQGYSTLMPFESDMDSMNRKIHTENDVIGPDSNFRHSLVYSKIALVIAMDLGNSTQRQ